MSWNVKITRSFIDSASASGYISFPGPYLQTVAMPLLITVTLSRNCKLFTYVYTPILSVLHDQLECVETFPVARCLHVYGEANKVV